MKKIADDAKGFMPPDEAEALWDAAWAMAPSGVILEVGTYCGKSATWLGAAAQLRGGRVVTIDHHRGSEENQAGWEHHDTELVDPEIGLMDTLPFFRRTDVRRRSRGHRDRDPRDRAPTSPRCWSTPLAMLFIDGGHAEEHAQADYANWAKFVVPQGVLAIHDVFEDPADGGQAPYHIYQRALGDGFIEVRQVGSLPVASLRSPGSKSAARRCARW